MQVYKELATGPSEASWSYGTFNPVLEGSGGVGPCYGVPGNGTGFYYKSGQMVAVNIVFSSLGACSAPGSALLITGIPFVPLATSVLFKQFSAQIYGIVAPINLADLWPDITPLGIDIECRTGHNTSYGIQMTNETMSGGYVRVWGFYLTTVI